MRYLASHENMPRGSFDFPLELYHVDERHPRYEMPFHWHVECELLLVLQGTFRLSLDGEALTLHAGDTAFIPGGAVHGGVPERCVYECAVFDMERFLAPETRCGRIFERTLDGGAGIQRYFAAGTPAAQLAQRLFAAVKKEQPGCVFTTTGLLWEWLGLVLEQKLYAPASAESEPRRAAQMKDVLRFIRSRYAQDITLAQLAAAAGMAPTYFCRVFRRLTGRSPIDYVNYYRIECASELLCATSESITDIALRCGFGDLNYFIRLFRRYKKCSARTYRRTHAAETAAAPLP